MNRLKNVNAISNDLIVYFKNIKVTKGMLLPLSLVQIKPTFSYNLEPNKYYSFIIVDPDAPVGFMIHLCVCNITITNKGFEYYIYKPPAPPAGTGPKKDGEHRYFCILYEQESKIVGKKKLLGRGFKEYDDFKDLLGVDLNAIAYKYFCCKNGYVNSWEKN